MSDVNSTPEISPLGGRKRLKEISEQITKGQQPEPIAVRELLRWFGSERRGSFVVDWIRGALSNANLATVPDFEGTYLDGQIRFVRTSKAHSPEPSKAAPVTNGLVIAPGKTTAVDPTYRIGKLRSANTPPISVKPQQKVAEAVTIMLANDFSQLPVMDGEREVKGIISWTSIGSRFALGVQFAEVRECMDRSHEISADKSFFEAINDIVANQYVLIRDSSNKIAGIVTTSDLSLQFRQLAEPFLLLGEVENHVRRMIERGKFTAGELQECCDPETKRTVSGPHNLSIGEYIRLLENPKRWSQLRLEIDRRIFIDGLERVRHIRNEVMHFDPDGISDEDLGALRKFAAFLQRLQSVLPASQ